MYELHYCHPLYKIVKKSQGGTSMDYGELHMRINEILEEKGISKNRICKDLDIPRTNFNKYCRDGVTRLDTKLICKLCWYLNIEIGDLIEYKKPNK